MADGADIGIHKAREFGRDIKTEARRIRAEGNISGSVELIFGEFLINIDW